MKILNVILVTVIILLPIALATPTLELNENNTAEYSMIYHYQSSQFRLSDEDSTFAVKFENQRIYITFSSVMSGNIISYYTSKDSTFVPLELYSLHGVDMNSDGIIDFVMTFDDLIKKENSRIIKLKFRPAAGANIETQEKNILSSQPESQENQKIEEPKIEELDTPKITGAISPNVISKALTQGIIGTKDAEIVFEVSNEDAQHKIEGFLACDVPSDIIVTSSIGAATGEEAQYMTQKFTLDPSPSRKSMSLRFSSFDEGHKLITCSLKYAFFLKHGYLTQHGQYVKDISEAYQEVTINRDISFAYPKEDETIFSKYKYIFFSGIFLFFALIVLVIYLVFKLEHMSAQIKK